MPTNDNNLILMRMRGAPAQPGTPETDADPRNPNASHAGDYGDACGTMREAIRATLGRRNLLDHPQAEAIVETMLWQLHDESIAWALREIIDRPDHLRR